MRALVFFGFAIMILAAVPTAPSLDSLGLIEIVNLQGPSYHVQGVDTDGEHVWTTSVDAPTRRGFLTEYSMKGDRLRSIELQDGARFHPGGFALKDDSLWIPVAEYRAKSSAVIQRRNKHTLKTEFEFSIPDHIGCLAVTSQLLIGGNWDSRDFYIWNHQGKLLRKVNVSSGNAYQDMKANAGYLIASGVLADHTGAVDWLNLNSFELIHRMKAGTTDRGAAYTREGMGVFKQRLLFLPEDEPSRLFTFDLKQ